MLVCLDTSALHWCSRLHDLPDILLKFGPSVVGAVVWIDFATLEQNESLVNWVIIRDYQVWMRIPVTNLKYYLKLFFFYLEMDLPATWETCWGLLRRTALVPKTKYQNITILIQIIKKYFTFLISIIRVKYIIIIYTSIAVLYTNIYYKISR